MLYVVTAHGICMGIFSMPEKAKDILKVDWVEVRSPGGSVWNGPNGELIEPMEVDR